MRSHLLLALAALPLVASAIEFETRQISRENTINRDPVISETGLAAWMYYETNDTITAFSHIAIYYQNKQSDLTAEMNTLFDAAAKPFVQSNQLVFIANYRTLEGGYASEFQEVPWRDEGAQPELPALYTAEEEGGVQRLKPVIGQIESTNAAEVVAKPIGLSTNAMRRDPSGLSEIWRWRIGDQKAERISNDNRNDFNPSAWGNTIAWQKARGWPFGWEIMTLVGDAVIQLTTNYYYEMAPKAQGDKIVWYGWDGFDYEIFMFDRAKNETLQITSNRYDDVAPIVWDDVIVWEGYPAVESDIFMWRNGEIAKISTSIDDDLYPRIWNNKVVWQGFDGDDFEIYFYDVDKGGEPIKITTNDYDDTNPEIHDDLIVWMGYHENWDSEIFYADLREATPGEIRVGRLTEREEDDREPKTASRRIIWVSEEDGATKIMLAEPR